jgi:inhibitor of KinA
LFNLQKTWFEPAEEWNSVNGIFMFMNDPLPYVIHSLGDSAAVVDFGNSIDKTINNYVLVLFHHFKNKKHPAILDIVPAYSSLSFFYDVVELRKTANNQTAFDAIKQYIKEELENIPENGVTEKRSIKIPVCYSETFAPDIAFIASEKDISVEEIIRLHASTKYTVYMIGFLPGFPYMGTVDERIAFPRKTEPRTVVPAGSVGIAGKQTGIYPLQSPGGWQIIGRTPIKLFDKTKENPVYLEPGDEVEFYSITEDEFENY